MAKKALIFGIAGQDGSYLTEHLLSLGYEVHGMIRRNSVSEHQASRLDHLGDAISTYYGDLQDASSVDRIIQEVQPDEIYNLAAQSHVRISFDMPELTMQINAIGVFHVLEAFRKYAPSARFYQASSSEMFGNTIDDDKFQRETTPMSPVSPYGCAKLFAYALTRHYRRCYKLFACNGILFNHESFRRASNFVTSKIVKAAAAIACGKTDKLVLGNMDSFRDWGHASDYTKAMHLMVNHTEPDDFVISTMEAHSVRDFCEIAFDRLGLNYRDYVEQDAKYMRPEELKFLRGDSTKARTILGWKPEYTFETLVAEMVDFWVEHYKTTG
ncbi:hypothetical protein LCGC14_1532390 [marine sediment metagenome]|uniref:GDP-mannose 4,6-dehydratase n=1 Tax=marine sediment metagenome TaxID=412755 RepID=A0A0F9IVJ3_9ZZZZ